MSETRDESEPRNGRAKDWEMMFRTERQRKKRAKWQRDDALNRERLLSEEVWVLRARVHEIDKMVDMMRENPLNLSQEQMADRFQWVTCACRVGKVQIREDSMLCRRCERVLERQDHATQVELLAQILSGLRTLSQSLF